MKIIVLEHPRMPSGSHVNDIAHMPLWACLMSGYASAALDHAGHDVIYLDALFEGWDFIRTQKEIISWDPRMLCIHGVFSREDTPRLLEMLSQLRFRGFKGHICLFGFFPSLAWPVLLQNGAPVDTIVVGEPENTLCSLAEALEVKENLSRVSGLAFHGPDGPLLTGLRKPERKPDRFVRPQRHHLPGETIMMLGSRGCHNHRSFCPVPSFWRSGPLWQGREPEKVIEEMRGLIGAGANDFYFADSNFIGPGKEGNQRALRLAGFMASLKISFSMGTRPEELTLDLLMALKKAGLKRLVLEVETGAASMPGHIDKHGAASEKAIQMCRAAGIEPEIDFLMFRPDSSLDSLEQNFHFLESNHLLDRPDRTAALLSHRQIIFMGTPDYRRFQKQGRLVPAGPFGFLGDVAYRHPNIGQMSDIISFACLSVLRETRRPQSAVYREKNMTSGISTQVNAYLTDLFKSLLGKAGVPDAMPGLKETCAEIQNFLERIVNG